MPTSRVQIPRDRAIVGTYMYYAVHRRDHRTKPRVSRASQVLFFSLHRGGICVLLLFWFPIGSLAKLFSLPQPCCRVTADRRLAVSLRLWGARCGIVWGGYGPMDKALIVGANPKTPQARTSISLRSPFGGGRFSFFSSLTSRLPRCAASDGKQSFLPHKALGIEQ